MKWLRVVGRCLDVKLVQFLPEFAVKTAMPQCPYSHAPATISHQRYVLWVHDKELDHLILYISHTRAREHSEICRSVATPASAWLGHKYCAIFIWAILAGAPAIIHRRTYGQWTRLLEYNYYTPFYTPCLVIKTPLEKVPFFQSIPERTYLVCLWRIFKQTESSWEETFLGRAWSFRGTWESRSSRDTSWPISVNQILERICTAMCKVSLWTLGR